MKKKRYFISYSFIDVNGTSRIDNAEVELDEKKIFLKEVQNSLAVSKASPTLRILYFVELKDYEQLEK